MDRIGSGQSLERPGELDDLLGHGIGVDRLAELAARLERLLERLTRALRDELRDPVDGAVRNFEHATGIAQRRSGGHRGECDDLCDPVAAVLLRHVVDHALATLDREVDVHVRHVLAGRVEEALEQQPVPHRVDVRDAEAVGGERARGRAAARSDGDAVALREVDEVGDDQEVVREAHLADRPELELEPLGQLRRRVPVAPLETALAELDQVVERVTAFRRGELGQEDPAELDLHVATLGHLERSPQRVFTTGKVERHLGRRLEVELVRLELPVVRILERIA